jgi:hypothetical protein
MYSVSDISKARAGEETVLTVIPEKSSEAEKKKAR